MFTNCILNYISFYHLHLLSSLSTGFDKAQAAHVEASKGETKVGDGSTKAIVLETAHMAVLQKEKKIGATDDSSKYELGPEGKTINSKIMAMFDGENFLDEAKEGASIGLILDVTPFYAEQGGQVSDIGTLASESSQVDVLDCRKYGEYTLHQGIVRSGTLKVGDSVASNIDIATRKYSKAKESVHRVYGKHCS